MTVLEKFPIYTTIFFLLGTNPVQMKTKSTTIRLYSIFESFGAETQELKNSTILNYNRQGQLTDSTLYTHSIPLSKRYIYITGPEEGVRLQKTYDKKVILSYHFTYNLEGNRISTALYGVEDTLFWKEYLKYDINNRLVKKIRYSPGMAINSENLTVREQTGELIWGENYNYDSTGTMLEKEEIYDGYILEVTTFNIDILGVPQKRGEYFDPSVIFRTMYFHNEFGQLVNEITVERLGKSQESRSYEYDGFGRRKKTIVYNSDGLPIKTINKIYRELDSRITEVQTDSAGSVFMEIETRLDKENRPFVKAIIDEKGRLTEKQVYKYDIKNRVASIKSYDMLRRGKNDQEIPITVMTYEYE